ncbi:unnamed protein product, partial [Ectocarpus sp. 12 AP-2014]
PFALLLRAHQTLRLLLLLPLLLLLLLLLLCAERLANAVLSCPFCSRLLPCRGPEDSCRNLEESSVGLHTGQLAAQQAKRSRSLDTAALWSEHRRRRRRGCANAQRYRLCCCCRLETEEGRV